MNNNNLLLIKIVSICLFLFVNQKGINAMDNGLFLTPPMGWLSWARFRCNVDCETYPNDCLNEKLFMDMADRLVSDGWKDAGYDYINIDDCWAEMERDPITKRMVPDKKRFPNGIKALSDYIHSKGLKIGIYSDTGKYTCAWYPGSEGHYELDAQTFAEWEVDSLKFDGCFTEKKDYEHLYPQMSKALNATGRPIAYICSWPAYVIGDKDLDLLKISEFCNQWRNYDDINDYYPDINTIVDWFNKNQDDIIPAAGPGGWNDPDMLVIGNFGLTASQSRIQMGLWAIMAAPLMLGNDLRAIAPEFKEILLNKEVIAVNQDRLGKQGGKIPISAKKYTKNIEIFVRSLENGDLAVVVTYRYHAHPYFPQRVKVDLKDLGWKMNEAFVRNLFDKKDIGNVEKDFYVYVEPQGATMLRLSKPKSLRYL